VQRQAATLAGVTRASPLGKRIARNSRVTPCRTCGPNLPAVEGQKKTGAVGSGGGEGACVACVCVAMVMSDRINNIRNSRASSLPRCRNIGSRWTLLLRFYCAQFPNAHYYLITVQAARLDWFVAIRTESLSRNRLKSYLFPETKGEGERERELAYERILAWHKMR